MAESDKSNLGAIKEDTWRGMIPEETINISVILDAADQLELPDSNPVIVALGLHPALAALELLLYPRSSETGLRKEALKTGSCQVLPPDTQMILFVWGPSRVVPVLIESLSITEEAFDPMLNPIRARVELGMKVLTELHFREGTLGYIASTTTVARKEILGMLNLANSSEQIIGLLPF